ncbi:MAG: LD-carboxypeptidase [Bacteroidota bacterium]
MSNNSSIPPLQAGDLIYITAPAKAIDIELVENAKKVFEERGYKVMISEHCTGNFNYFSGSDEERLKDFQFGIDHPEVKAIICARGGYGCVRIVDQIGWAGMLRNPKWIVGFSDVTVFHQRMQRFELPSIHATMPLNYSENNKTSLETMFDALEGKQYTISCPHQASNKLGEAKGTLLGGNLSILYSLLGTDDQVDYSNSVLFIEDLAEQLYHIDRIFYSLRKAGVLEKIKGLIVGGMSDMKDTAIPFGQSLEEIILSHFQYRKIPIAFHFPAGHQPDNRALIFGSEVQLIVDQSSASLHFL